jgi:hypothetical protein
MGFSFSMVRNLIDAAMRRKGKRMKAAIATPHFDLSQCERRCDGYGQRQRSDLISYLR